MVCGLCHWKQHPVGSVAASGTANATHDLRFAPQRSWHGDDADVIYTARREAEGGMSQGPCAPRICPANLRSPPVASFMIGSSEAMCLAGYATPLTSMIWPGGGGKKSQMLPPIQAKQVAPSVLPHAGHLWEQTPTCLLPDRQWQSDGGSGGKCLGGGAEEPSHGGAYPDCTHKCPSSWVAPGPCAICQSLCRNPHVSWT